jgi:hypothetical protein
MSKIPSVEHPVWEKLVTGTARRRFSLFAANMAVDLAVRTCRADPSQRWRLASELHEFFLKYENLTANELSTLL